MNLPEVDQLRCFVAAAEALHFRRAAAAVHVTPAALGKQVRRLEERLGSRLFQRTTRQVRLTPRGQQLQVLAQRALDALAACTVTDDEPTTLTGEITLGSRQELAVSWLLPALNQCLADRPALRVNFYVGAGPDLLARVRAGEIDAAVSSARFDGPELDFEQLHEEAYVFVAAPKLLEERPLRRAVDAPAHTLLDTTRARPLFRYWKDAAPADLQLEFGDLRQLGSISLIRAELIAGRGVAVLPLYYVDDDLKRRRLVPVLPRVVPLSDAFRLVFRRTDRRRDLFRELASRLRTVPLR